MNKPFNFQEGNKLVVNHEKGCQDLAKMSRVAEIHSNIKKRTAKVEGLRILMESRLQEIEIIEQLVEVDGTQCVLFLAEGMTEGVFIDKADIDSGALSLQDGYNAVVEMFSATGQA